MSDWRAFQLGMTNMLGRLQSHKNRSYIKAGRTKPDLWTESYVFDKQKIYREWYLLFCLMFFFCLSTWCFGFCGFSGFGSLGLSGSWFFMTYKVLCNCFCGFCGFLAFVCFSSLSLYACVCERTWHMFSTSVLTSPFSRSENNISGHLLILFCPTISTWFVFHSK